MPFANNHGINIHYDATGSGPAVLLVHGLTASRRTWVDNGYPEALERAGYRAIVLELRGHGESDKPHDPAAYAREQVVGDVLAVLDAAGAERATYWGYSLGGAVGYAAALLAAERFDAFIIGGMHPYQRRPVAGADPGRTPPRPDAFRRGMQYYYDTLVKPELKEPLPPDRLARLLANDGPALAAFMEGAMHWMGQEESLARLTANTLLYAGDADPQHEGVQRAAATVPGSRFVSLSGLDHTAASVRAHMVLPHVLPFLASVVGAAIPSPLMGEG